MKKETLEEQAERIKRETAYEEEPMKIPKITKELAEKCYEIAEHKPNWQNEVDSELKREGFQKEERDALLEALAVGRSWYPYEA